MQKNIRLEVIVADDGSEDNHEEELKSLFASYRFSDYKLVMNPKNQGTVKNLLTGIMLAEGRFVKSFSPGDQFVNEDTLKRWVDFMDERKCGWSFSDAIYYRNRDKKEAVSVCAHPQDIQPYIRNDLQKCRWNYVVLKDIALGAAILCRTDTICKYTKLLHEQGIIYAEDNMWRLLMFLGDVGCYFQDTAIYYECETGISTSGGEAWSQRLRADWENTDKIMKETKIPDRFQMKMLKGINYSNSILRRLFTIGKIRFKVNTIINKRMTEC